MTKTKQNRRKPGLILASASTYRRQLLERLCKNFTVLPADIDESRQDNETANCFVTRLAREKAHAVAERLTPGDRRSVIIGSDQIAVHEDRILGKPGDEENARKQLSRFSGSIVRFLTAVCVLDVAHNVRHEHTDETLVHFRDLSDAEIEIYVAREQPFDCAGGFKAESLGIVLFNKIESQDPTGLLGLPLIWVAQAIRDCGIPILDD